MKHFLLLVISVPFILFTSCVTPNEPKSSVIEMSSSEDLVESSRESSNLSTQTTSKHSSASQSSHTEWNISVSFNSVSSTHPSISSEAVSSIEHISAAHPSSSSLPISSSSKRNPIEPSSSSALSSSETSSSSHAPIKQPSPRGTLTASFTPVTYNGEYAPKNYYAIWITKADGTFVRSLKARVQNHHYRPTYLYKWQKAKSSIGLGLLDAITGASANGHSKRNITWNLKNHKGKQVTAGKYKLHMEFTEQNEAGPHHAVKFTLDNTKFTISDKSDNYKNISITFVPQK
ncbi:MAG: DUF2271 domain-containing protein [Fibrobacterales bacterium]